MPGLNRFPKFQAFTAVLGAAFLIAAYGSAMAWDAASANSAPPPGVIWFYIEHTAGREQLSGAQLWGCEDTACAIPVLLQSWGECTAPDCLPGPALLNPVSESITSRFECGGDICRSAAYKYGYPTFRLALQLNERLSVQTDGVPLPVSYGETHAYRVIVNTGPEAGASSLTLEETPVRAWPGLPIPPILPYFGLTLLVELIVAGVYGLLRWKISARDHISRLALIALINVLTYPVVWGFFPTLLRFPLPGARTFGWGLAAFLMLLSGLLWLAFNAGTRRRVILWSVACALCFISGLACLALFAFGSFYGGIHPSADGYPVWLVLLMAETYAILVEALLLFGFSRRQVRLQEALLVSLMMNIASFVIGLLIAL